MAGQNWAISPTFTYSPGINISTADLKQFKVIIGCGASSVDRTFAFKQTTQINNIIGYKMFIRKRA